MDLDYEPFKVELKKVDSGNYDVLLDSNINTLNKSNSELKRLYLLSFLVITRYSAIERYEKGLESISAKFSHKSAYDMKTFLDYTGMEDVSFADFIANVTYVQLDNLEERSNQYRKIKEAIVNFELFLSNVYDGDVLFEEE